MSLRSDPCLGGMQMKVKELQEQLNKLDPDLDILGYSEDESILNSGRSFVVFDIVAIDKHEAERLRLEDETPYLKFERGPASKPIAILEITSDH